MQIIYLVDRPWVSHGLLQTPIAAHRDLLIAASRGTIFDTEYLFCATGERSADWVGLERTDASPFLQILAFWVVLRCLEVLKILVFEHLFIPIRISYNIRIGIKQ